MSEIDTTQVYKQLKKQNGEEFAKILRENALLNTPNLKHILEFAGKNPEDAKLLVPVLREIRDISKEPEKPTDEEEIKDPIELLNEAGYDAFIVKNLLQQNSIAKYFASNEELCLTTTRLYFSHNFLTCSTVILVKINLHFFQCLICLKSF